MKLHNTLTRSVDTFTPISNEQVTLYSCGPTVYDYPHIGNWTSYIRWDILARSLRQNYNLNWYMNITDVGHLVSDADDGEDKLEKGARREGKSAWGIAEFYTEDFKNGLKNLNISVDFNHLIKATDHIQEQIELVKILEEKGFTYIIDDGVYFDSTKFADYGKMAKLDIEGMQAGVRVDLGQKHHGSDFALWKFTPSGQVRDMEWDSPWGKGFPGWHIECSAMAMKYLGETIDIHTGGIDHIPVHHTNEIAQSEAVTGKRFVNYWLHSNFMQVDGTKISKSLGNVFTLQDITEKGFTARDLRMLVLQSHYRTEANFTWEALKAAQNRYKELQAFADLRFQPVNNSIDHADELNSSINRIKHALEEDLNTPKALAELSSIISLIDNQISSTDQEIFVEYLSKLDELLGFNLLISEDVSDEIKSILNAREAARTNKDWQESDRLRDDLNTNGISVKDTPYGYIWSRI